MANDGHRGFVRRYAEFMAGVFLTLGSIVYFTQLPVHFAPKSDVAALKTEVKQSNAKTAAAVTEVKQQSSQAAGSAATAQMAAREATKAADLAEQTTRRRFQGEPTKMQIKELYERSANNRAGLSLLQKQFDDYQRTHP